MALTLLAKSAEQFKKAIPSLVYFNHFAAIAFHIDCDDDRNKVKMVPFFTRIKLLNADFDITKCRQLLWNSWSTENAFLFAERLSNHEYYKFSLQWGFPQAYYSVYLNMAAFHETQGTNSEVHEKSIKIFGNSVKDGHYPRAICFHASGMHEEFKYLNLSSFTGFRTDFNGLSAITDLDGAHLQLATFLKSTRIKNAEDKRDRYKKDNNKDFRNKQGEFLKAFRKSHWDKIYGTIPVTSVLNLLYRLRIKANYRDIETFINADINFAAFHRNLASLVYYLNSLHECYTAKAIGKMEYIEILDSFPKELIRDTASKRFTEIIDRQT